MEWKKLGGGKFTGKNGHAQRSSLLLLFWKHLPRESKCSQLQFEDLSSQGKLCPTKRGPAYVCVVGGGVHNLIQREFILPLKELNSKSLFDSCVFFSLNWFQTWEGKRGYFGSPSNPKKRLSFIEHLLCSSPSIHIILFNLEVKKVIRTGIEDS